jgi:rSAM/selenodomain-associated transferase 1
VTPAPAVLRSNPALAVIAKAPDAGRAKTRMCPPLAPAQAAAIAEASLAATLAAAVATPRVRPVCVLDGEPGGWLPAGVAVVPQRGGGLDERLADVFADVGAPAVVIGMDTPQVTPALLAAAVRPLVAGEADAVLGPAADGGYWAIGLAAADRRALVGVPMSSPVTFRAQRARLRALGLRVALLPTLRDVDGWADALAVAAAVPRSAFAAAVRSAAVADADVREAAG